MIIEFIKLRIRETARSSVWQKNMIVNIVFALLMLYLMACFLVVGFVLDKALGEAFPGSDPVELFNRMLLYYFGLELLVRFFMQHTPAMSIAPFLHLPVKRSFLMHFLLMRSIVNPVNYISFLIFVPFASRAVSAVYSGAAACWWLLALFLTIVFVIFVNVYIKRQMVVKPAVSLGCGLAYIALFVLDYFHVFSLSSLSSSLFGAVLTHSLWILVPVLLAAGIYLFNYRFLITHSYSEEIDRTVRTKQIAVQGLGFMSRFGQTGELMGVELKLMLRHKRTKTALYLAPVFMLYGLIFYPNPQFNNSMMWLIFVGVFITGFTMLNYGQFIVAWEGRFFDGILTREGSFSDYLQAKYYLLASFCLISYVLTIPYVYFGTEILWINTACCLFNIGAGAYIMLWFAQYNRKRIDLSQGSAMNWQGVGASQFIVMLPVLLLPMFIASVFKWVGLGSWGLGALAILGIIGIVCGKWFIQAICRRFTQTKYALAEGFRSKN
ncbi:MAG: DUF5687 family protein [Bacteroidales bacterium]|jgi:hypothetical protein|nr:DUF5687 family protein [Bacteroidales bacterium]